MTLHVLWLFVTAIYSVSPGAVNARYRAIALGRIDTIQNHPDTIVASIEAEQIRYGIFEKNFRSCNCRHILMGYDHANLERFIMHDIPSRALFHRWSTQIRIWDTLSMWDQVITCYGLVKAKRISLEKIESRTRYLEQSPRAIDFYNDLAKLVNTLIPIYLPRNVTHILEVGEKYEPRYRICDAISEQLVKFSSLGDDEMEEHSIIWPVEKSRDYLRDLMQEIITYGSIEDSEKIYLFLTKWLAEQSSMKDTILTHAQTLLEEFRRYNVALADKLIDLEIIATIS